MDKRFELTMPSRIGRSALAIAMTAAIGMPSIAMMAQPSQAYAADGSVTITAKDNTETPQTYKVYQVFTADIDNQNKAQHIAWNDAYKDTVLTFLNANGYAEWLTANNHKDATSAANPQNAAEYIAAMIEGSAADTGAATTPKTVAGDTFAMNLAQALDAVGATSSATAGTAFTGAEGYYLFVSDANGVGEREVGTAPIWVPLGGSTTTITEKTSVPTVNKQVKEDSGTEFGKAADANQAQELDYLLTGTLPSNIGAFESYHYKFEDQLPAGKMDMKGSDVSSVVVKVDGKDVTSQVGVNYANSMLTVNIEDLLALEDPASDATPKAKIAITKDTQVTVEYKAHLTTGSTIGSAGNQNEVELTYTADPVHKQDQKGLKSQAKAFTYQLDIVKADKQTGEKLANAKFTLQVAQGNSDADSVGKYVQADGSLGTTAYEFTTSSDGKFTVPRIDEGTYTVHETAAPEGYAAEDADITIVISSTLDQQAGACTNLTATVSGGEAAGAATDVATHLAGADDVSKFGVGAPNVEAGTVGVVTSDPKEIVMPVTGLEGTTALVIGATAAVVIGGASLLLTRKRKEEGQE